MVSLLLIAVPVTTAVPMDRSVVLHSCAVAKHAARCGALMVPEDRLTGTGRQIPLRVVVVPASGRSPRRPDRLGGRRTGRFGCRHGPARDAPVLLQYPS